MPNFNGLLLPCAQDCGYAVDFTSTFTPSGLFRS
ncbi:hypothetical protein CVAR21S_03075 [Corynebacterium variabile]